MNTPILGQEIACYLIPGGGTSIPGFSLKKLYGFSQNPVDLKYL
jgi:hypothetical protein